MFNSTSASLHRQNGGRERRSEAAAQEWNAQGRKGRQDWREVGLEGLLLFLPLFISPCCTPWMMDPDVYCCCFTAAALLLLLSLPPVGKPSVAA